MLIVACGGASSTPTTAEAPAVRVLEAGSEPRRVVRYELAAGLRGRVELTSKATVTAALTSTVLETTVQKTEFPTERTRLTLEVLERPSTGDVWVTSNVDGATLDADGAVDAGMRGQLERDVAKQRGTRSSWWMTPAGLVEPIETKATEPRVAVTELIALAVGRDVVQFPAQPIGVGASWQVTSRPKIQGVQWERIETLQLRGITGDVVTVDSEVVLKAREQDLVVEPTATTRLTSGSVRTTSKIVMSLRALVGERYGESAGDVRLSITNKDLRVTSSTQVTGAFTAKPL
jgi:hypothetical protein